MNEDARLSGQVAVVTGAAGAIGSAVAAELQARGAQLACVDVAVTQNITRRIAEAAAAEGCGGANSEPGASDAEVLAISADLTDEDAVSGAIARVVDERGGVDILVNMAGLYYGVPRVPFWEIDTATWDSVVDSNLRTAFLCARAVAPHMRAVGSGRVVNVSSNVSAFGMANFMHYVSAKAALVGMTRAMARELGPSGIAVNAVAPGLVRTPQGTAELAPEYWDTVVGGQCLRMPIEIRDVINAVAFLACAQSRMITGQTLLVNGGATMGAF